VAGDMKESVILLLCLKELYVLLMLTHIKKRKNVGNMSFLHMSHHLGLSFKIHNPLPVQIKDEKHVTEKNL